MDRQINVYLRDRNSNPLPRSSLEVRIDDEDYATYENTEGHATIMIADPVNIVTLTAKYKKAPDQIVRLGPSTDEYTFHFDVVGRYSNMAKQIFAAAAAVVMIFAIIALAFYLGLLAGAMPLVLGIFLLIISLTLAFIYSQPSLLQAQLIRSTFALAAGCLASQIPGLLNVSMTAGQSATITAAGALAVYVIVFFFSPAKDS